MIKDDSRCDWFSNYFDLIEIFMFFIKVLGFLAGDKFVEYTMKDSSFKLNKKLAILEGIVELDNIWSLFRMFSHK